jgi:hypothetical protein
MPLVFDERLDGIVASALLILLNYFVVAFRRSVEA